MHCGFQLQGSFKPESLLLQKATDVSLVSLGSSYLDRHHRDTVHNKHLFEFSARDCALTPDHWRADLIPATRCLCEILKFLSFTNTSSSCLLQIKSPYCDAKNDSRIFYVHTLPKLIKRSVYVKNISVLSPFTTHNKCTIQLTNAIHISLGQKLFVTLSGQQFHDGTAEF